MYVHNRYHRTAKDEFWIRRSKVRILPRQPIPLTPDLDRQRLLAPAIVGAISFVVYLRTLLPGIAFGDWGEMQTVPHVLGVPHPTGYPTYILLSWLAHLVPIGSIAFRANLLSAVLVASALAVTVAILVRLGIRPLIAAGAALALGAVGTVWAAATVAEVNPLHLLFVALLLHRALVWEEGRRTRDLLVGALLLGLALGNHLLMVFVAPFVALFVLWVGRREIAARPWMLAAAAGAGLLGLSTYLYVPIAAAQSPPLAYNNPVTLEAVLWLVGGTQFRSQFGFLSSGGLNTLAGSLGALWPLLANRATPVAPILGLIGLALLIRKRPAFGLMCAGILLANIYFWATYVRLEHYLLAPLLVLMIGAAVAVEGAARALAARRAPWLPGFDASPVVGAAAVVFSLALAVTNWQAADRSGDRSGDAFVETVFAALPENAAIISEWDASTPMWHARYVLERRPDVLIVDDTNIVYERWGTRERRIASLICDRPVFVLRLRDSDLESTRAQFRVEPFLAVEVAAGGPSAAINRQVFRVEPRDPAGCGG
jgi:Protein O-mannosyl-transferase TMEM260-like